MNDIEPVIPSPGGIPPWDPPDDIGDLLAHDGWAAWVEEHGNLSQRLQLMSYRIEQSAAIFMNTIGQSCKNAVEAVSKFAKMLTGDPPR